MRPQEDTISESFFEDNIGRGGVRRDRAGNALLLPRGSTIRAAYTSASGLADFISDKEHIHRWKMRNLAKGMGQSPDLCLLAASEVYSTGFDGPVGKEKSASGRALDGYIARALDRVVIDEKADYGTAVHAWTEPGNNEPVVGEKAMADVGSFWAKVSELGIKILDTELFVANDAIMAAGTLDHLCWVAGYGWVICDKKTGKRGDFGIQFSTYAFGEPYNRLDDTRETFEETFGITLNREVGLVFAIKDGETHIEEVDLIQGWEDAQTAAAARDYDAKRIVATDAEPTIRRALKREREALRLAMRGAVDYDALLDLHRQNKHIWNDDLTAEAQRCKEALQ